MATANTRFTALIREHSRYRSAQALGDAIGAPTLPAALRYARKRHQLLDGDLLARIAAELDPTGRALLVDTLAWDGQLPGYDAEADTAARRLSGAVRSMDPEVRELMVRLVEKLDKNARDELTPQPDDDPGDPDDPDGDETPAD